jgi:hypothetical protein
LAAIGQRHGVVAAMVQHAASWMTAAANRTQAVADEIAWRRTIADVTGDRSVLRWAWCWCDYWRTGPPVAGEPVPVMPLKYARQLDVLDAMMSQAVLAWQGAMAAAEGENPEGLIQRSSELIAIARHTNRSHIYDGNTIEGQVLWQRLDESRAAWATEIADAAEVFTAAGIPTAGLNVYVATMTELIESAAQTLRRGYTERVKVARGDHLPSESELPTDPTKRAQFLDSAARNICGWMGELADGGVTAAERETVLRELEATHSESVAAYRRIICGM